MARGQATEEELSANLSALGGVAGLTAPGRLRRDGPFASLEGGSQPAAVTAEAVPVDGTVKRDPVPAHGHVAVSAASSNVGARKARPAAGVAEERHQAGSQPSGAQRGSRVHQAEQRLEITEPVTVPMTSAMRAKAAALTRMLQQRRSDKSHRFTANSVYRAAIEAVLDVLILGPEDRPDTEEEWRRLVMRRLRARR